jgi:hypothetical protein
MPSQTNLQNYFSTHISPLSSHVACVLEEFLKERKWWVCCDWEDLLSERQKRGKGEKERETHWENGGVFVWYGFLGFGVQCVFWDVVQEFLWGTCILWSAWSLCDEEVDGGECSGREMKHEEFCSPKP